MINKCEFSKSKVYKIWVNEEKYHGSNWKSFSFASGFERSTKLQHFFLTEHVKFSNIQYLNKKQNTVIGPFTLTESLLSLGFYESECLTQVGIALASFLLNASIRLQGLQFKIPLSVVELYTENQNGILITQWALLYQ